MVHDLVILNGNVHKYPLDFLVHTCNKITFSPESWKSDPFPWHFFDKADQPFLRLLLQCDVNIEFSIQHIYARGVAPTLNTSYPALIIK
jgi:hypothetical protein